MTRSVFALLSALCLAVPPARGEVIEVLLPGLAGAYSGNSTTTRSATIQLPRIPDLIHSVSIRVEGVADVGVAHCQQSGTANVWPMEFIGEMTDSPDGFWLAFPPPRYSSGPFESAGEFEPMTETTTWAFLMDGEGEITLSGGPASELLLCDPIVWPDGGNVTEAWLIVDAEFPLAVEASTWGRVKALYR
jgi:hypothetical protein